VVRRTNFCEVGCRLNRLGLARRVAVCAVREIETIGYFSPDSSHCETFAREMSAVLGVEVEPVGQPEDAIGVDNADMRGSARVDAPRPETQSQWAQFRREGAPLTAQIAGPTTAS
jgi:hypothetical protein